MQADKSQPWRETALLVVPVALILTLVLAIAFWAMQQVKPAVPKRLVIAAASKDSPYDRLAEHYKAFMARSGITLEVRETTGSVENLALLTDPNSGVGAGFLQGGVTTESKAPGLRSMGRVLYEPLWIFARAGLPITRIADLAGKRVMVGPAGGGTNLAATRLLEASGVTASSATLINAELPATVEALEQDQADAAFLVLGPSAKTVQRMFHSPGVKLVRLAQAEAYAERFPFLSRLDLKAGVIDFAGNTPESDTGLLVTSAAVVVRPDVHPALVSLLAQAIASVHAQPAIDANGEAPVFERAGQFPTHSDPEFPMAEDAARFYKQGAPFLQRYLPFWLATLFDRLAILALPLIGILLPVARFAPALYNWNVRRRLLHWYQELKRVEAGVRRDTSAPALSAAKGEVDSIEEAVDGLRVPLNFANQLYDLRQHIEIVRRRLDKLAGAAVGHVA